MKHLYSSPYSQLTGRKVLLATPHSHPIPFLLSSGYTDAYTKYLFSIIGVFFSYKHELKLLYQSLTQRGICRHGCLYVLFFTIGTCIFAILSLKPDHTKNWAQLNKIKTRYINIIFKVLEELEHGQFQISFCLFVFNRVEGKLNHSATPHTVTEITCATSNIVTQKKITYAYLCCTHYEGCFFLVHFTSYQSMT